MKSKASRVDCLREGDWFEFTNLDSGLFRNLRVKAVSDCSVLIDGEHLVDKEGDLWRFFGVNYSISCATEVRRVFPSKREEVKEEQEKYPEKRKRGRPRKK